MNIPPTAKKVQRERNIMYYFAEPSIFSYNIVLVLAAVLPAALLMLKVYRSDRLEREPFGLLWKLLVAGILSSLLALVVERFLISLLDKVVTKNYTLYMFLLYFVVVAYAEEGAKYFQLKRNTWVSSEFNCQYDGVVYAVFVSLGFALWENISYVMNYGVRTAIIRAFTAIPGHACFGVFMGVFYGIARKYENRRLLQKAKAYRVLAVVVPAVLHGAYDYIASVRAGNEGFIAFIAVLFILSWILVSRLAKQDQPI